MPGHLAVLPLLNSACQLAAFTYADLHGFHPLLGILLDLLERGLQALAEAATAGAAPILQRLEAPGESEARSPGCFRLDAERRQLRSASRAGNWDGVIPWGFPRWGGSSAPAHPPTPCPAGLDPSSAGEGTGLWGDVCWDSDPEGCHSWQCWDVGRSQGCLPMQAERMTEVKHLALPGVPLSPMMHHGITCGQGEHPGSGVTALHHGICSPFLQGKQVWRRPFQQDAP